MEKQEPQQQEKPKVQVPIPHLPANRGTQGLSEFAERSRFNADMAEYSNIVFSIMRTQEEVVAALTKRIEALEKPPVVVNPKEDLFEIKKKGNGKK